MKRKTLSIVVFLLAVVLFGLLFVNHRQAAHMQQLQKEERSYQLEIDEIRSDLAQRELAVKTTEDTSGILFGFVPASTANFAEIDKLASEHSLIPVIILDCSQKKDVLTAILKKAVGMSIEGA